MKFRRSGVVITTIAMFALGAATATLAGVAGGFGSRAFQPNQTVTAWSDNSGSTRSTHFDSLPLTVYAASRGPATFTFNASFSGAGPIALRIVSNDGHVLKPGAVKIGPTGAARAFSFTFVAPHGAGDCTSYTPEWRSVSGDQVEIGRADVVVTYHRPADNTAPCDASHL